MSRKRRPSLAVQRYWIGYCRKSTETEDRQIHSLADQAALVQAHYDRLPAEERSNRPLKLLQEARSAYRPGRPVFDQIMRMAARGAVWGIIVVHPNRISRNHSDSGSFVQRLVDGQIECLDTTGGKRYTGEDSNDIFMLTLEGAMSWKDSRDKGDRILDAMHKRATEGNYQVLPPVGYRIVYREDGKRSLQIDAVKAPIIRRLFDLAAAGGHSLEGLAKEGKRLGLTSRKGKPIQKTCLHNLLTNPFFKGYIHFDGIVAKGIHEPLVSEDLWDRVRRVFSGRRTAPGPVHKNRPNDPFVFRGVLGCPRCPRKLYAYRAKRRYIYYECKNPRTSCGVCVPQAALLAQLDAVLDRLVLGPEELADLRRRLLALHEQRIGDVAEARRALQAEHDQIQQEIVTVLGERREAARLGVEDVIEERLRGLTARRDDARRRLASQDETGAAWVDRAIRALELVPSLTEAIRFGPPHCRALGLKALSSNPSVKGGNLDLKPRSPFRQVLAEGGDPLWCTGMDEARTETRETLELVEIACHAWRDARAILEPGQSAVTAVTPALSASSSRKMGDGRSSPMPSQAMPDHRNTAR